MLRKFAETEDGMPSVNEETGDVALRATVSLTKVVPQSLVLTDLTTDIVQVAAPHGGETATPMFGS
jgi:hypothetical protein